MHNKLSCWKLFRSPTSFKQKWKWIRWEINQKREKKKKRHRNVSNDNLLTTSLNEFKWWKLTMRHSHQLNIWKMYKRKFLLSFCYSIQTKSSTTHWLISGFWPVSVRCILKSVRDILIVIRLATVRKKVNSLSTFILWKNSIESIWS